MRKIVFQKSAIVLYFTHNEDHLTGNVAIVSADARKYPMYTNPVGGRGADKDGWSEIITEVLGNIQSNLVVCNRYIVAHKQKMHLSCPRSVVTGL